MNSVGDLTPGQDSEVVSGHSRSLASGRTANHRRWLDVFARVIISGTGWCVIGTIALILVYLLVVAVPLTGQATLEPLAVNPQEASNQAQIIDDKTQVSADSTIIGLGFSTRATAGYVAYRNVINVVEIPSGRIISSWATPFPVVKVTQIAGTESDLLLVGEEQFAVVSIVSRTDFTSAQASTLITFETLIAASSRHLSGVAERHQLVDVHLRESEILALLSDPARTSHLVARFQRPLFSAVPQWHAPISVVPLTTKRPILAAAIENQQRRMLIVDVGGTVTLLDLSPHGRGNQAPNRRIEAEHEVLAQLALPTEPLTATALAGGQSLLIALADKRIVQVFANQQLGKPVIQIARSFVPEQPTAQLIPEPRRKSFASLGDDSELTHFHGTTGDMRFSSLLPLGTKHAAFSPNGGMLLSSDNNTIRIWQVNNPHPEVSWSTLWYKTWYEGYAAPAWLWQSSSAELIFEPKFSLTPLFLGTLKGAFFAMLFAIPIAILGAIYSGYFMSAALRGWLKPGIEIMEALPTVVLGFLAGLWFAPLVERNLMETMTLLLLMPPLLPLLGAILERILPTSWRERLHPWLVLVLVPAMLLLAAALVLVAPYIEYFLFRESLQQWLDSKHGISYDQRNALIVGIAMGIAIMPTVFSLSEDAVFAVPRTLVNSSLALGASRWQTLIYIVLLTASPGIFAAVILGMSRAIGETMIVLMATGNTPLSNFNLFEGMRTISANIAVELPEAELASTHYRILFLTALILFVLTFILNSIAELVRGQLRSRYAGV